MIRKPSTELLLGRGGKSKVIYIRHITLAHGFQWTCWLKNNFIGTIVGGGDMGRFSISPHIIVTHVQIFYLITFQNIPKNAGTFIYFSPHSLICGYILLAVISAIDLSNPNKMKSTEGVQWLPEPLSQPLCAFFNSLSKLI